MNVYFIPILCCCIASIISCIVCITIYVKQKKIDKNMLLSCRALTQLLDIFSCIITILNPDNTEGKIFTVQGIGLILIYSLIIQLNMIIILKIFCELKGRKISIWIAMLIEFIISILICILASFFGHFSPDKLYCEYELQNLSPSVLILMHCMQFIFTFLIISILYKIYKIVRSRLQEKQGLHEYLRSLIPFPIIFTISNFGWIIRRIIITFAGKLSSDLLLFSLAACLSRSHGLINGLYTIWLYKMNSNDIKTNNQSIDSCLINTLLGVDLK